MELISSADATEESQKLSEEITRLKTKLEGLRDESNGERVCRWCGEKVQKDASFCTFCGYKF